MNPTPSSPPPAGAGPIRAPQPADIFNPEGRLARLKRAKPVNQLRMEARHPAESGANHARHHVSRKTQS